MIWSEKTEKENDFSNQSSNQLNQKIKLRNQLKERERKLREIIAKANDFGVY